LDSLLYDTDVVVWAETQAALLRRLARGERVNDIDWENVVEEIESVGISEIRAVESLWFQAMLHLIKLHLMPDDLAARHWGHETTAFLAQAADRYLPSMRRNIDLDRLWGRCRKLSAADTDGTETLPRLCPWPIEQLLDATWADLVRTIQTAPDATV
jgi:transposase